MADTPKTLVEVENSLFARLFRARKAMLDPKLDGENPHFGSRFISRNEAISAALPALQAEGLLLTQGIHDGELVTTVQHLDEYLTLCRYPINPDPNPQRYAANCTYASRVSLVLSLCLQGATDDDGNTAAKLNYTYEEFANAVIEGGHVDEVKAQKPPTKTPWSQLTDKQREDWMSLAKTGEVTW